MKTRNSFCMSLLCSVGWGPRRSRAPRYFPESLSSGWMTPNRKRGCLLVGTPATLPGKRGRRGERSIPMRPPVCSTALTSPSSPASLYRQTGPLDLPPLSPQALASLLIILHVSCLSDCFHFRLRMQSIWRE